MTFNTSKIIQALSIIVWGMLLTPAILSIYSQKTIHPKFTDKFTTSDIYYLLDEIFTTPGEFYVFVLHATGFGGAKLDMLALPISVLLFLPLLIWPFLKSERYRLLKKMLCAASFLFVAICISLTAYIFLDKPV